MTFTLLCNINVSSHKRNGTQRCTCVTSAFVSALINLQCDVRPFKNISGGLVSVCDAEPTTTSQTSALVFARTNSQTQRREVSETSSCGREVIWRLPINQNTCSVAVVVAVVVSFSARQHIHTRVSSSCGGFLSNSYL